MTYQIPENLSFNVPDVPRLLRSGATPGLFERLERRFGPVHIAAFEQAAAGEQLDRMTGQFAAEVLREYKPQLLLLHFLDADHRQHFSGPASVEAKHAFELIDRQVGRPARTSTGLGGRVKTTPRWVASGAYHAQRPLELRPPLRSRLTRRSSRCG